MSNERSERLTALQPYWEREDARGPLSPEDRAALDAQLMPPGASRAGIRSAELTAKIAFVVAAVGGAVLSAGLWSLIAGGPERAESGVWFVLVLLGGLPCLLGFLVGMGSLASKRRFTQVPLRAFTDRLVDVRAERMFRGPAQRAAQLVLEFEGGHRVFVPVTAQHIGPAVEPGHVYRVWYLEAAHAGTDDTLIYIGVGST